MKEDHPATWYPIGSFNLKFKPDSTATEGASFNTILSRAYLYDISLIVKSKRKGSERMEIARSERMEIARSEDDSGITLASAVSEDDVLEDGEIRDELPTSFTGRLTNNGGKRKRKSNQGTKKNPLAFYNFEEYWQYAGEYVTLSTWFNDHKDAMTEENQKEVHDQIETCLKFIDLASLLTEHIDMQSSEEYSSITSKLSEVPETFEELYAKHCEIVKHQSRAHFEARRSAIVAHRAKDLLQKLDKLGFTPGFDETYLPSKIAKKELAEAIPKQREQPKSVVTYEGGVFDDVTYSIADGFYSYVPAHQKYEKTGDDSEISQITEDLGRLTAVESTEPTSSESASFEFDEEKEAHLVAKNAKTLYADDPEICKYYYQRYRLFSKLDEGIIMDREGWFSVTPERIAENIAKRVVINGVTVVLDAFAGVGGNSIQFALEGAYVIAIDMDPIRLKCARHNARVYGVEDYITFICADFFHFAALWEAGEVKNVPKIDAVFLSPPWGGPSYLNKSEFDITTGCTPNGIDIFNASLKMTKNIAYYLPKNTKLSQLIDLSQLTGGKCEIEQSSLNDKVKTITAYYGDLVAVGSAEEA